MMTCEDLPATLDERVALLEAALAKLAVDHSNLALYAAQTTRMLKDSIETGSATVQALANLVALQKEQGEVLVTQAKVLATLTVSSSKDAAYRLRWPA